LGSGKLTYVYRCTNKKCPSLKQDDIEINTGWKSSCCNLCDNRECPDHGECRCFNQSGKRIIDADMIEKVQEHYKNNDIEIETYE